MLLILDLLDDLEKICDERGYDEFPTKLVEIRVACFAMLQAIDEQKGLQVDMRVPAKRLNGC